MDNITLIRLIAGVVVVVLLTVLVQRRRTKAN